MGTSKVSLVHHSTSHATSTGWKPVPRLRFLIRVHSCAFVDPSELEYLKTVVSGVYHDDAIFAVDDDAPRVGELPGLAAGGAPGGQALAGLLVDLLDAVVAELAD